MRKALYMILLMLCCNACFAQQVPTLLSIEGIGGNSYDNVRPRVVNTPDGGFILSIYTSSASGPILCDTNHTSSIFMKYNADGTVPEWKKCFNNAYMFLYPAPDGNFIVGGWLDNGATSWDYYISKIDTAGNTIWIKYHGGSGADQLQDMMATDDGGYILLGYSYSNDGEVGYHHGSMFFEDMWAIKVDSSGDMLWSTVLGGSDVEAAISVVPGPGGGCYLMGTTISADGDCTDNHGGRDILLARLDDSGHVLWHKCLGGAATEGMYGWACSDNKDGILLGVSAGSADGDVHGHIGDMDYWLVDVDSGNHILWDKCYGGSGSDAPNAVAKSVEGNILLGGWTRSPDGDVYISYGNTDGWVVQTDSLGNFLSSRVLGAASVDVVTMVFPIVGDFVFTGGRYEAAGPVGGEFPSVYWGADDIFLAMLAPWTTGIPPAANATAANGISIYPNPAWGQLNISFEDKADHSLAIHDMLGREMYRGIMKGSGNSIDVHAWARGMYYVELRGSGQGYCLKLALQ